MENRKLAINPLNEWSIIKVSGADKETFLQGQITNDITLLADNEIIFAGHCDPKGKLISPLILFKWRDAIYYLLRSSLADAQLAQLKKYAVFSKVTIERENSLSIYAALSDHSAFIDPHKVSPLNDEAFWLPLDHQRAWLIAENTNTLPSELAVREDNRDNDWNHYLIMQHFPIVDAPLAEQFLPQAFNLEAFDAINYKKGCYCGQEMVARAHFRGANKRALYTFKGAQTESAIVGQPLEEKLGENWRETGMITAVAKGRDETVVIQVILSSELDESAIFRVKGSELYLTRLS